MRPWFYSGKALKAALWLCLCMSFALSTIPRCRALVAMVGDLQAYFADSEKLLACHESQAETGSGDRSGTQLAEPSLCPCDLLSYLSLMLPGFDPHASILVHRGSVRLLSFSLQLLRANFALEPPVPHPKA